MPRLAAPPHALDLGLSTFDFGHAAWNSMRAVNLYRDGVWLAGPLEVAETFADKTKGLLGRDGLPDRRGMVIEYCGSIHTCFMRFAIDVVFLAADGRVRKIAARLKPWRFAMAPFARRAVELPAGLAAEIELAPGQIVELR